MRERMPRLEPCNMASSSSAYRCSFPAHLHLGLYVPQPVLLGVPCQRQEMLSGLPVYGQAGSCPGSSLETNSHPPLLPAGDRSRQWALNESCCTRSPQLSLRSGRECSTPRKALAGALRLTGAQGRVQAGQWGPREHIYLVMQKRCLQGDWTGSNSSCSHN